MIFGIRDAKPDDLVHLQDCDVKCFDYGWNTEEWSFAAENYAVRIAHYYGTPIGFAVFVVLNEGPRVVHLFKLGVKPNFRRRKVGLLLIKEAKAFAQVRGISEIEAIIPEMMCRPGEPRDITGWLKKVGFKGTGIVPNYIHSMGINEDGYKFNLKF